MNGVCGTMRFVFFLKKISSNIFQVDNFCIFVLSLAGESLATGGRVTDIYLKAFIDALFWRFHNLANFEFQSEQ